MILQSKVMIYGLLICDWVTIFFSYGPRVPIPSRFELAKIAHGFRDTSWFGKGFSFSRSYFSLKVNNFLV